MGAGGVGGIGLRRILFHGGFYRENFSMKGKKQFFYEQHKIDKKHANMINERNSWNPANLKILFPSLYDSKFYDF